jgi:hypothetical protein
MAKTKKYKRDPKVQYHFDRWADLMERILEHPEIADRIPNKANVMFGEGDVIFINGEPRWYSELVRVSKPRRKASAVKIKTKAGAARGRKVAA